MRQAGSHPHSLHRGICRAQAWRQTIGQ